tara:strand:- start:6770 stop:7120 length:351 start_codon:yes stop_codon:yes gene_type:complete
MSAIIGIGFLIKYTLVSGRERWLKYGNNVELYLFNMDRHQWGNIHLVLGYILIGLLVVHIFLHWKIVSGLYKKLIKEPFIKKTIAICFATICALLILIPLFIKPEIKNIKNINKQI